MDNNKYKKFIDELFLHAYENRRDDILKWIWNTKYSYMRLRETKMMIEYFFDERTTLKSIAINFGVTQERVRQLLCKTMRRLKHQKSKESLISCLDENFRMLISKRNELEASLDAVNTTIGDYCKTQVIGRYADITVESLEFSVRTYNCFKDADIKTVTDLCNCSECDLLNLRSFGKKSLEEIKEVLSSMGLSLRPTQEKL